MEVPFLVVGVMSCENMGDRAVESQPDNMGDTLLS